MITVIKPERASEILKEAGYTSASPVKIRQGLIQGIFPFGQADLHRVKLEYIQILMTLNFCLEKLNNG